MKKKRAPPYLERSQEPVERRQTDRSVSGCMILEAGASPSDIHLAPKRGYTAKKRNEAAQIAAQNGQCFPMSAIATVDRSDDLTEMMASVAYQPQTEGGRSTES